MIVIDVLAPAFLKKAKARMAMPATGRELEAAALAGGSAGPWHPYGPEALSAESARRVIESLGVGILVVEADLRAVMVNAEFERLTGRMRGDILGSTRWMDFILYNRSPQGLPDGTGCSAGNFAEIEAQVVDRSGTVKDFGLKFGLIPHTHQCILAFYEITGRKRAERDLLAVTSQMRDVVRAIQGFIYSVSADRRLNYLNEALADHLGIRSKEPQCHMALFGQDSACAWCPLERVLAGETEKAEIQSPLDGRWYYAIHSPVSLEPGRITGAQVLMIDITERKVLENSLIEAERKLREENVILKSSLQDRHRLGSIIGKSPAMQRVFEEIVNAAATDANLIITGESGTGKELVARTVHELSARRAGSIVPVNCGAIPETLMESEFFGYRKGAFTGATIDKHGFLDLADGGTLFLDELGELGQGMQVKLLRAIDGGGFSPLGCSEVKMPDFRIMAATNRNLSELMQKGVIREDFFYRIHVIPIRLPPLRERREDIPLLVDHFVTQFVRNQNAPPITLRIMAELQAYDWPGNVRELQNTIYRYLTLKKLEFAGPAKRAARLSAQEPDPAPEAGTDLDARVARYEKQLILKSLEQNRWHREATADALKIHRKTLFTKMKKYGLIGKGGCA
jgi:transcriptional regulator with PAS, ATPase and Fis domain